MALSRPEARATAGLSWPGAGPQTAVLSIVLVVAAIAAGTSMQRVAGMGFAMISAPMLVLLLGPREGVLLVNLAGALTSALVMSRVWREVEWRRLGVLAPTGAVGVLAGAVVAARTPAALLEVVVGSLIALGLTAVLLARRATPVRGNPITVLFGAVSGASSVMAGTAGPAMSVYAVLVRWDQRRMAATVQPFFVVIALGSVVAKSVAGPATLPDFSIAMWAACLAAALGGLAVGELVSRRVAARAARRLTFVVAYLGSLSTIVHGVVGLTG
ncbi:sulfite exporter TauE/SafE family protein [Georgenia sp. 10Sc9-8]|uniref:Probable membrane transporter protein n=1 Tax=Georgenia halotolerans TaxID=3028317 RepID=A0ABT5TXY0_9MICO|nr:sulfite exporter TauE/SafE family protein [Georgenia halotolerans]